MGKEIRKNCEIVASIQKERTNAKLSVDYQRKSLNVIVDAKMSMVDGKLQSLVTGLGGAFCCLPTLKDVRSTAKITSGFKIDLVALAIEIPIVLISKRTLTT